MKPVSTPVLRSAYDEWLAKDGPYICDEFIDKHFEVPRCSKIRVWCSRKPMKNSVRVHLSDNEWLSPNWAYTSDEDHEFLYDKMATLWRPLRGGYVYVQVEIV